MTTIREIYPKYSHRLLDVMVDDFLEETEAFLARTRRTEYNLGSSFATQPLSDEDLARIRGRKVVCMSLYFKASQINNCKANPTTDHYGQILISELHRKYHPAWAGSRKSDRTFFENYINKVLESDFRDWIPLVYLANDLCVIEPILKEHGWIVIRSRHNSLAHCPGAMWRYLGFNLNCEYCYIQDTDRAFSWNRAERLLTLMNLNSSLALARPLQCTSPGGEMALILGNDFVVRPDNIHFNSARMMLGYIILNILHEDRINNFVHEPLRGRSDLIIAPISKRLEREHFGPLPHERTPKKNFPYYGVDESWLREFVYYQLSDGRIATLIQNENKGDQIQQLDLSFQRANGNLIAAVKTLI